jgi:hypothetical protein
VTAPAHRINQGATPDLSAPSGESDFYFVAAEDPETAVRRILELLKTRIPKRFGLNSIRDIQVLCPMNRGGVDARSLNIELQAALNPAGERKVERFGKTFAPADEVMQIENDYDMEVYNGDIGYVLDDEIIATWTLAAEVGLQFRPMVVPILRDICEHLRAVDATVRRVFVTTFMVLEKTNSPNEWDGNFLPLLSSVTVSACPVVPRNT